MRPWPAVLLVVGLSGCAREEPIPSPTKEPAALSGTLPGDRLPAFRTAVHRAGAADAKGEEVALPAAKGVTVLVVMSTTCPFCNGAADSLRRAESTFQSRGVDFVYLYPDRQEAPEVKAAWHAQMGFRAGISTDPGAAAARLLEVDKTPTAFVVDGKGVIAYRGAVADASPGGGPGKYFLADALDEVLAGKPVSVPSTPPAG